MAKITGRIKNLIRSLISINDTPQKIALGLGLGVFAGIFPGTGPIAALFLASLLRVNRAASLLGSLATNTWLSVITLIISTQVGALIFGLDWHKEYGEWLALVKQFRLKDLVQESSLRIILPVFVGYCLVGLSLGFIVYLICLAMFKLFKQGAGSN